MATQTTARLADRDGDYKRFGVSKTPSYVEDGIRTQGGKGTFEWWYTDVTFDDGTAIVVIFFTKNYFDAPGPAWPTADFEIVDPSGKRTNVWTRGKKGTVINAAKDVCDVRLKLPQSPTKPLDRTQPLQHRSLQPAGQNKQWQA